MYDRLPTHMNLWRRKVILFAVDTCCSMCSYEQETLDHLLILCPIVVSVWTTCYRWFGLNTVLPGGCRSHLQQHVSLDLNSKQNEAFRVVWFVVTWLLWLHRNYVIFNNEGRQHDSIFEGAQLRAWNLLSGRIKGFNCSIYEWLAQPICCLKTVSYTCAVIVWFLGCYSLDLLLHMLLIWLYWSHVVMSIWRGFVEFIYETFWTDWAHIIWLICRFFLLTKACYYNFKWLVAFVIFFCFSPETLCSFPFFGLGLFYACNLLAHLVLLYI